MTELIPAAPAELAQLAGEIRREVERADLAWHDALAHAIRAGELLIEAKAKVRHGQWLPWLEARFPGSIRSAQNYMRLAAHTEDAQTVAHLGIAGALKQLAAPSKSSTVDNGSSVLEEWDEIDTAERDLRERTVARAMQVGGEGEHLEAARLWLKVAESYGPPPWERE